MTLYKAMLCFSIMAPLLAEYDATIEELSSGVGQVNDLFILHSSMKILDISNVGDGLNNDLMCTVTSHYLLLYLHDVK